MKARRHGGPEPSLRELEERCRELLAQIGERDERIAALEDPLRDARRVTGVLVAVPRVLEEEARRLARLVAERANKGRKG